MHVHLVFVSLCDEISPRGIHQGNPRSPAGELSAEGVRLQPREQPERRLQPHDPQKELLEHPQEARGGALWSPSYFAGSCGGAPIEIIRQYIEPQQTPH